MLASPIATAWFSEVQKRRSVPESVDSFLIKPVQRITKYQLLLKDLLACSRRPGEIAEALDVMLSVPQKANDAIHVSMLQGTPPTVALGEVVLQAQFTVWLPKQLIKKPKVRRFFRAISFHKGVQISKNEPKQGISSSETNKRIINRIY